MSTNNLWAASSLLLISGFALADSGAAVSAGRVTVSSGNDAQAALHLEAQQASWAQIFTAIEQRTGLRTHHAALPDDERVDARCAGAKIEQIVTCLLGPRANLLFSYTRDRENGAAQERAVEAWVIGRNLNTHTTERGSVDAAPSEVETPEPQPTHYATDTIEDAAAGTDSTEDAAHWEAITATAAANAARRDPQITRALSDMSYAPDAQDRSQALSQLVAEGPHGDPAIRATLQAALGDAEPSVRAQAVYGLAQGSGPSSAAVLHSALADADADVRLMAVDSAGADAAGIAVLRAALADSDATVRELAAAKLEATAPRAARQ